MSFKLQSQRAGQVGANGLIRDYRKAGLRTVSALALVVAAFSAPMSLAQAQVACGVGDVPNPQYDPNDPNSPQTITGQVSSNSQNCVNLNNLVVDPQTTPPQADPNNPPDPNANGVTYNNQSFTNTGTFDNGSFVSVINGGVFTNNGIFNNNALDANNGNANLPGTVTLDTNGTFINNGSFNNNEGGVVNFVGAGSVFTNAAGGTFNNFANSAGITFNAAGTLNNAGVFNNYKTSGIDFIQAGTLNNLVGGTFNNAATDGIVFNSAATLTNAGTFNNEGSINFGNGGTISNLAGGTFNNTAAGALTYSSDATFNNAGVFNGTVAGNIVFNSNGTFNNSGTFNDTAGNSFTSNGNAVTFNNQAGGVFNTRGGIIDLGTGTFNNAGTLNIGAGGGALATTTITGNYNQTSTGTLALRANWGAGLSDKLSVSGTAALSGTINPTVTNLTAVQQRDFVIVTASSPIVTSGLSVSNTATVNNSLVQSGNDLVLRSVINFQGAGGGVPLTGASNVIGGNLNSLLLSGNNLPFMTQLLQIPTGGQYNQALQMLAPVTDGSSNSSTMVTAAAFSNQLLSCKVAGDKGDSYAIIREGQCAWARVTARHTSIDASANGAGASERTTLFSTGAQFNLGGPWRIGAGLGYEEPHARSDFSSVDTRRVHLGGVLKYNTGPWLMAFGLTGGFGWSDSARTVAFGGINTLATSSFDSNFISGRFTSAYLMRLDGMYLKPQVELAETYLNRGSYVEAGAGGVALAVADSGMTVLSFSPSVEMGTQVKYGGILYRPYGKIGGTWRDKDTLTTTASFAAAGAGAAQFGITSRMDKAFFDLGSGVDMIMPGDTVLRFQYDGQYGETSTAHSGSAKLSVKF